MAWADEPDDQQPVSAEPHRAAELNAFTISQAERQWMHQPGTVPPVASGTMAPLSREFEPRTPSRRPRRPSAAERYLHRMRNKQFLSDIEIVDVSR